MTEQHIKDWVNECIVDGYIDMSQEIEVLKARAERAEAALRTLVEAATPFIDSAGPLGYRDLQDALDKARAALPGGDTEG